MRTSLPGQGPLLPVIYNSTPQSAFLTILALHRSVLVQLLAVTTCDFTPNIAEGHEQGTLQEIAKANNRSRHQIAKKKREQ